MNLPTSKYIEIKVNLIILVIINKTLKMSTPKNNYLRMLEETRQDSYKQLLPIIYEKLNSRQQGIPNYNLTPKTIYSRNKKTSALTPIATMNKQHALNNIE